MSIGSVFHDSYQYTEFSRVSKIALNNAYKLNSPIENVISLYTHVANSYYNLEEYDSSKAYYNKILDGFDEMGYSINVVKSRAELYLGMIKIKEEKYLEAVQDLDKLLNILEDNQDTLHSLLVLSKILEPLKELNKIDHLNTQIDKMELFINNYKLNSEELMEFYWSISKVLRQIDVNKSEYYKNMAIENMDIFLKQYISLKDKELIKSNHETLKEINFIIN